MLSRTTKLHLRKLAEHLDFDKELLAKKGPTKLVIWTYFGYLQECVDEAENGYTCTAAQTSLVQY